MEFHEDLFPDTAGCVPASDPHAWWAGSNQQVGPRPGWPLHCPVQLSAHPASNTCPTSPSDTSLLPQVQKVSLHPAHRPYPSFTSCLVPPAEPAPEAAPPAAALPADTPAGDADPSVSTWAVRPSSPSCRHRGSPESKLASTLGRLMVFEPFLAVKRKREKHVKHK